MPKYFVNEDMQLSKETEHHLKKVLRVKPGRKIILGDGKNFDYHMIIKSLNPLELELEKKAQCKTESEYKITLYQALAKSDKLEWVIQKAVELGAYEIVPIVTEHCDVRPNINKLDRYKKIAEAAAGQSMRGIIPQVNAIITLDEAIQTRDSSSLMLVAHEKAKTGLKKSIANTNVQKRIGIWIGPEGGFSQNEIDIMERAGFKIISLGERILRTETAAIVAIATLQAVIE